MTYTNDSPQQPATVYRRLSVYPRSPNATGVDFTFEPLGDLNTTQHGDLSPTSGSDLITQALMRRLYTPEYGYRRWVRTPDGLKEIDTNYGNKVYSYLSAPLTALNTTLIERAVREAAQEDQRIRIVNVISTPGDRNEMNITLFYRILPNEELIQLDYVLNSSNQ